MVTGGGGTLCRAMAHTLANQGAKVTILDLREDPARQVANEISRIGGQALGVQANVLDLASLKTACDQVQQKFGDCDILINGAGGNHPKGTTTEPFFYKEDFLDPEITILRFGSGRYQVCF